MIERYAFLKSFKYALRGIVYTWAQEQNFRIQVFCAAVVFMVAFFVRVSYLETALLALAISGVLVLELVNTVAERIMDALNPRIHPYATVVKDVMAGAVLIAALGATLVGIAVLVPKMIS